MAGNELKDALKNVADHITNYVKDAATLTVETRTQEVGSTDAPKLAARTIIKLDGDNTSDIPVVKDAEGNLVVDQALYEVHLQNLDAAIEYRAKMLESMLGLLRDRA